jgi:hypothetical protein
MTSRVGGQEGRVARCRRETNDGTFSDKWLQRPEPICTGHSQYRTSEGCTVMILNGQSEDLVMHCASQHSEVI